MASNRRSFNRPYGERRYKKLFIIATEGQKTEPQYFALLDNSHSTVKIKCLLSKSQSAPTQVLRRMNDYLKKEGIKKTDEAWIVVDKDQWTDEQLAELYKWSLRAENLKLALSNPKFEYWLLLHFEDGHGIISSKDCSDRLLRHLPKYDKGIDSRLITQEHVASAIKRAQAKDNPPCTDWPRQFGTTMYRLVKNVISCGCDF